MRWLRMCLIIVSFFGAVAAVFAAKIAFSGYDGEIPGAIMLGMSALLGLNWYYLVETPPPAGRISRLARLCSLWLQSKERELEDRANPRAD